MALNPRVLVKGGATDLISVSLPSYDVTTATLDQMQFDSRWAGLQLFMQGSISVAGVVGAENIGNVSFGTTLSQIPLLMVYAVQGSNAFGWTPAVLRGNSSDYWWAAETSTTGLSFRNNAFATTLVFHYTVFQRPSG